VTWRCCSHATNIKIKSKKFREELIADTDHIEIKKKLAGYADSKAIS
jgi:hypothetical protein